MKLKVRIEGNLNRFSSVTKAAFTLQALVLNFDLLLRSDSFCLAVDIIFKFWSISDSSVDWSWSWTDLRVEANNNKDVPYSMLSYDS